MSFDKLAFGNSTFGIETWRRKIIEICPLKLFAALRPILNFTPRGKI
jgi:hypothetical protein